ncbi:hypothetical protein JD844_000727 [Phrynosoma platyrhinos]|uniref:Uncharacterized protein n=1 Tax=Phrynosoma platyrhinos TaxID=52577 RepID=A0ABQ7T8P1_PHRPL|nr:hypothetical protein JD844_000727 [Phrynosoma platyrhinos]
MGWRWLCLGGTGGAQRPCWYYGELGAHYGTPESGQRPTEPSFPAQKVILYSYWVILGFMVVFAILLVFLWIKQAYRALKKRMALAPVPHEDPEELALMETLHLLDAVMVKVWRHLQRMERGKRKRGCRHPKAPR